MHHPITREQWLQRAVDEFRPIFEDIGFPLPEEVQVSVGFPGGGSRKSRIGECWSTRSAEGVNSIFIHPKLSDPVEVLSTLAHELIHAADDCEHGHRGPFVRAMRALGLGGKPTSTTAGDLEEPLTNLVAWTLGEYPHRALKEHARLRKKQSTRMLKMECDECGYIARTTRKWLESYGTAICPCNGEPMALEL